MDEHPRAGFVEQLNMELAQMIPTVKISGEMVEHITKNGNICPTDSRNLITYNEDCTDYKYWNPNKDTCNIEYINIKGKKKKKTSVYSIVGAVVLITISILGFIYPIRDLVVWEKLNMRPGLPPFGWWANPPESMKLRGYIFNVTNHERFLRGLDDKINVEEIGPIVYSQILKMTNIRFTENDTMTYLPQRQLVFHPEESKYNVNDTVILPNSAILGVPSMLYGENNFFRRMGFNFLLKIYPNNFFVKKTIHQFLWDYRENIMEASQKFSPDVHSTNMGFLNRTYEILEDELIVKIGPRWGHENFFKIHEPRGTPPITGYDTDMCLDNIVNTTEGVLFSQYLKKEEKPLFFSKAICKILPLIFEEERSVYGLTLYRYNFSRTAFHYKPNVSKDCHNDKPLLPSGLKDASTCYEDFPMVLSLPHFNGANISQDQYVSGLKPDPEKHKLGYYDIEPINGIPISMKLRVQCNLWIHNISGLYAPRFDKFANLVLPLVWFEFVQEGLPAYIMNFLYIVIVVLPILSKLIYVLLLVYGFYIIFRQTDQKKLKWDVNRSLFCCKNKS